MSDYEKTQLYFEAPAVIVRVKRGNARKNAKRFPFSFNIGRSDESDLQFADPTVSTRHAAVIWDDGQWWLKDLGSKNGTYLNRTRIEDRVPLPVGEDVFLSLNGPILEFEIEGMKKVTPPVKAIEMRGVPPGKKGKSEESKTVPEEKPLAHQNFEDEAARPMGERTRFFVNRAVENASKKHKSEKRTYLLAIGVVTLLFFCVAIIALLQIKKREELDAQAEEVFYAAKSIELNLRSQKNFDELSKQKKTADVAYEEILNERGNLSEKKLGRESWLIHRVARLFGEFDAQMPSAFVDSVKKYIGYLKSGNLRYSRFAIGITRAKEQNYIPRIVERLEGQYLPPQFIYLAMQESNFDTATCGPPIKKLGNICAKGMWQFIPETARKYDLRTGLRYERHGFDPTDERHNFEKSTRAAALYLRELYETDAQASGLLVMACYNWGEDNVLDLVRQMPKNPRQRNFWTLMRSSNIPRQTQEYVFYIFSSAVIGEDPAYFGFDFDNPLKMHIQ